MQTNRLANKYIKVMLVCAIVTIVAVSAYFTYPIFKDTLNKRQDKTLIEKAQLLIYNLRNYYVNNNKTPWVEDEVDEDLKMPLYNADNSLNEWVTDLQNETDYKDITVYYNPVQNTVKVCFEPKSQEYQAIAGYNKDGEEIPSTLATHYCIKDNYKSEALPVFVTEPVE